ncbi:MAG: hypothetical protein HC871_08865 [Rhizobiales bacterium]|nr:hypothetical protein [Hyphomicrobiales bacterium]
MHLQRQHADIQAFRSGEVLELPASLAIEEMAGLSREVRSRLLESRPATLGAAARLPGMTAAALALLYRHARRPAEP